MNPDYTDLEEVKKHEYECGWLDWQYGIYRPHVMNCFPAYRAGFIDAANVSCEWR